MQNSMRLRWAARALPSSSISQQPSRLLLRCLSASPSSSLGATAASPLPTTEAAKVAHDTTALVRSVLLPLNDKFVGPLERKADDRAPMPLVFVLGNHSSGKSTFINWALQRRVQEAGVAPTDDGFTIIAPGKRDQDQDGPALVGDPDWGFGTLATFGPSLVHHVRLKVRSGLAFEDIILVDSPGMIDSPTDSISYVGAGRGRKDRGYDFEGVARWIAEKADVILLFFDPDKPGTTGETLSVLTNSLAGMDYKLVLCLNKTDVFERTSDFARTYGALTWNLSKVIPRKDLPRIITTCTPLNTPFTSPDGKISAAPLRAANGGPAQAELDAARNEIVSIIRSAPMRRLDNMITDLDSQCRLLKLHVEMVDSARAEYASEKRKALAAVSGVGSLAFAFVALGITVPEVASFAATLAFASGLGAFGLSLYNNTQVEKFAKTLQDPERLDLIFRRRYARELIEKDEGIKSMWTRVRPSVQNALALGIAKLPKLSSSDTRELERIVSSEIPALRRRAQASRK